LYCQSNADFCPKIEPTKQIFDSNRGDLSDGEKSPKFVFQI
jgi:hypothetical protein